MDITVNRTDKNIHGVFGEIPELDLVTLEHAYSDDGGALNPKVPEGVYRCVRGKHTLPNGQQVETFEVTNVPGHAGILFHPGNYNQDSAGCFLVGTTNSGNQMITRSRVAFGKFMDAQKGCDEFALTVNNT